MAFNQSYTQQPYQEPEVDRLFRQLGMTEGMTPRLTQRVGRLEPRVQPRVGAGAPPQYQELLESTPKAIKQTDAGFFDGFASGLTSPVTDTLSGFGIIEPRELPTGLAGVVGNIAGSIVGWTGITVLTAGYGTKLGLSAKVGAATTAAGKKAAILTGGKAVGGAGSAIRGGLITEGTGAMMAKGGLWGGLSQAHTWAFGQQEYENIPREALIGTAVGIAGGAAIGKFTGHLRSKGVITDAQQVTTNFRERLLRSTRERDARNMITLDDKKSVYQGFKAAHYEEAAPMKQMIKYTNLTPETQGRMVSNLDAVDISKLPDPMQRTVGQLKKAKNYGEIETLLKKLKRQQYESSKSIKQNLPDTPKGSYNEASLSQQERIAEIMDIDHKVRWAMGEHISTVVEGNPAVQLPDLKAIGPTKKYRKEILEGWKGDLKENQYTDDWITFEPRTGVEEFLDQVSQRHKGTYRPFSTNFRDPSFLPTVDEQNMYRSLMANVKDTDVMIHPTGRLRFMAEDVIPDADIRGYLTNLTDLPDNVRGVSLMDELQMKSPVGWLTSKLAPVRTILGEPQFRKLRSTGQQYTKELGAWSKRIQDIGTKRGWTSQQIRDVKGVEVGRILDRDVGDAFANTKATELGRMAQEAHVRGDISPRATWRYRIGKEFKLPKGDVDTALKRIDELRITKGEQIREIAGQIGYSESDMWAKMYGDALYDAKLMRATAADAESFLTTPKVLEAAQEGRKYFDDIFTRAGLDPTMYRSAYLPHFIQNQGRSSNSLTATYKQIGLPEREIDNIFWANEMHRTAGGTASYDQNFFDAAERYTRGMLKKKHYDPVFDEMNKTYQTLGLHDSRGEVWQGIKQSIVGVPGKMEKEMDGVLHNFMHFLGKHPTGAMATRPTKEMGAMLAELQYAAGMGFNPFLPIRNLTQKALALSSITDSGNPIEGLTWMARWKKEQYAGTPLSKVINRSNDIVTDRVFRESIDLQPQGLANIVRKTGASDARVGQFDGFMNKRAMEMFRRSDISNVQDVFGAKALYLMKSKGAPLADAAELARSTVMATQFMYGIDSPMLYKTPIGKQIGIFQSWPLNWANMLWEQGTQGSMHRAASTILTMAVGAELLSMTGISFRSIHPTETAQGILPIAMLEGEQQFPLAFRSAAAVTDYMRSVANAEEEAVDSALNNFIRAAEGLVPFGIITSRTLQFLDRMRHDWRDFENPDRDFLNMRAAFGPNREGESRLMRMLGEEGDPGGAQREAFKAWFAPTTRARQRQEDWEHASRITDGYRRMRMMAVEAFIEGRLDDFQDLQERIVINYGQWIEPHDIMAEMERMDQTSRERQLQGLPAELEEAFFEYIQDPRPQRDIR